MKTKHTKPFKSETEKLMSRKEKISEKIEELNHKLDVELGQLKATEHAIYKETVRHKYNDLIVCRRKLAGRAGNLYRVKDTNKYYFYGKYTHSRQVFITFGEHMSFYKTAYITRLQTETIDHVDGVKSHLNSFKLTSVHLSKFQRTSLLAITTALYSDGNTVNNNNAGELNNYLISIINQHD